MGVLGSDSIFHFHLGSFLKSSVCTTPPAKSQLVAPLTRLPIIFVTTWT